MAVTLQQLDQVEAILPAKFPNMSAAEKSAVAAVISQKRAELLNAAGVSPKDIPTDPLQRQAFEDQVSAGKYKPPEEKLSAAQQLRHDNIQSALASLDSTDTNLQQGGGAKGLLAGAGATLPIIGKYLDPAGAAYHDTMIEPATSLAKAITNSSRAPESVVDKYMKSLPQINDTPEYAHQKMNKMRLELLKQAQTFKYNDITSAYDSKTGAPVQTLQNAGVLPATQGAATQGVSTQGAAPKSRFTIEAVK